MKSTSLLILFLVAQTVFTQERPLNAPARPQRPQRGPWNNDIQVFRVHKDRPAEQLTNFPRAGVSTAARLRDGRLVVAHQHFPENNDADFDKVAVHFSSDEGKTWTAPQVIRIAGLPEGMRFPFDPTLVPLTNGAVRLYFTSLKGRRFEEDRPAIFSAISTNCVDFAFEPGARFRIEGRPVIDCAVVHHKGIFHLFSPDNGEGFNPAENRSRPGIGYHATSPDGLNFTRQPDVRIEGGRNWLGAAHVDGAMIRFFGTGPGGVWSAISADGQSWTLDESFPTLRGADPGAALLKDNVWLLSVTGPPRDNENRRPPLPLEFSALDRNGDGIIEAIEIAPQARSEFLRRYDANNDGKISPDEMRKPLPGQR